MRKKDLDEYQVTIINKLQFRTLIILIICVIASGIYSYSVRPWADYLIQTITILHIPLCYFISFSILNNVYFRNKTSKFEKQVSAGASFLLSLQYFYLSFKDYKAYGIDTYIENNMLSSGILHILSGFLWILTSTCLLIRLYKDKKEYEE